jgi:hypothetical protein
MTKSTDKCICGGIKIISIPSLSEHLYPNQYDYTCNKCGRSGVGWRFGDKAQLAKAQMQEYDAELENSP